MEHVSVYPRREESRRIEVGFAVRVLASSRFNFLGILF